MLKTAVAATCIIVGFAVAGTANAVIGGMLYPQTASFSARLGDDDGVLRQVVRADDNERGPISDDERNVGAQENGRGPVVAAAPATVASPVAATPVAASAITPAANMPVVTQSQGGAGATTVAAIPEPETYAMMAIGLALMGFVARRRNKG
jgi:hypothetical protein